jgi:hypothetical protein
MKKLFAILVSACTLFSTAVYSGCGAQEETQEKGYAMLNDFESNDEFDLLRLFGVLGKVEKNTQAEYITSGKASAKLTVVSNPYKQQAPYMEQAFELVKKGEDYRNFTDVAAISFDVYNASQQPLSIGLQLTYEESNGMKQSYKLSHGWTTVSFMAKREYIPKTTNTDGVTAPWVENLRIAFERMEEDCVVYMDNVRIHKAQKSETEIRRGLKEDEICSFDREWQTAMVTPSAEKATLLPAFMPSYDITSTGTGAALRIETSASEFQGDTYPGVELRKEILQTVDFKSYAEDAVLSFDVYTPEVNGVDTVWLSGYTDTMRYYVSDEIHLIPGKWQTFSVSVKEMNEQLKHKDYNFATTTSIVFRWTEYTTSSRVVYFDNVRMER